MSSWRRVLTFFLLPMLLLTACTSVATRAAPTTAGSAATAGGRHSYEEARAEAEKLWDDYRSQAGRQTGMTNILYTWLSAIGATIIGLGVTGTSGLPITALGLAGGYSYGLGTWFTKPEHAAIYKTGAVAMRCIVDKSRPLGSAEDYATSLESSVAPTSGTGDPARPRGRGRAGNLDDALNNLAAAVSRLEGTPAEENRDIADKKMALDEAQKVDEAGRTVLQSARRLVRDLREAGDQVWGSVKTVETEVDYAIRRTTDARDIMAHIQQNVTGSYRDLIALGGAAPDAGAASAAKLNSATVNPPSARNKELHRAIANVDEKGARVAGETKRVAGLMEDSAIPGVGDAITQCLAAAQGLGNVVAIRVIPSAITLAPNTSQTVHVIGTTNALIDKVPGNAPITVTPAVSGGNTSLEVKANEGAAAGEYALRVIASIANNDTVERTVKVVVKETAPPKETAPLKPAAVVTPDVDNAINALLAEKGWTCEGKRWSFDKNPKGGTRATLACKDHAAAAKIVSDHTSQVEALKKKNGTVTAEPDGLLRIVIADADHNQFHDALKTALQ